MRRLAFWCCCGALLAGCAPVEDQPAADEEMAPPPAMISLADVAGRWSVRSIPATGDTTPILAEMVATADTAGWTYKFADRPAAIPMRVVAVGGDSIVTEIGPYESVLRQGVQVTVRVVNRLQEGRLIGTFVARYQTTGPDSILRGRSEGTRMP